MADTSLLLPSPPPPPCAPPHWRRGAANERRPCWGVMRAAAWKARAALLYSVGGWTALFGMMYYTRQGGGGDDGPVATLLLRSELPESSEHCVGALRMSSQCLTPDHHWKIVPLHR
ncbi:small integral membrane protein 26 isoform X2 [Myiozetetes cayanensis]|uniref:small integral membrane protein 26 isoform X2 n=1 Tax=Myiozetetes cayanensis TaxID=478635 RepID=UPI002160E8CA|nr:small integral membrane protein 26 isoform X2 [Myiozetetes cayanensis]